MATPEDVIRTGKRVIDRLQNKGYKVSSEIIDGEINL